MARKSFKSAKIYSLKPRTQPPVARPDNDADRSLNRTGVVVAFIAGVRRPLNPSGDQPCPSALHFSRPPAGTVDTLVKPENKPTLTKILTYHVVPGRLEASSLTDGKKLKTVEGEELTVKKSGSTVTIVDAKGGASTVTIPNVNQSNGVIHVVDTVLMPAP